MQSCPTRNGNGIGVKRAGTTNLTTSTKVGAVQIIMTLYFILSDIVARTGLDVAILLVSATLLTGMLTVWRQLTRAPSRLVKFSVWIPWLLAMVLAVANIDESWLKHSLLSQQGAVNEAQTQLMLRGMLWETFHCLAVGAVATFWLRRMLR